jgi:tetratricopeptide (TPR) repeat protein
VAGFLLGVDQNFQISIINASIYQLEFMFRHLLVLSLTILSISALPFPMAAQSKSIRTVNLDDFLASADKKEGASDYQGALKEYNVAIELFPSSDLAHIKRGILKYEKLQDTSGALTDYNRAIDLNPHNDVVYYYRGLLKDLDLNDGHGALQDYNKVIELNPKDDLAYIQRASLKSSRLNNVAGALADYRMAIEINPKNAVAYHQRGVLRADKVSDQEGAILDFRQAASLYREQDNPLNLQKVMEWLRRFKVSP